IPQGRPANIDSAARINSPRTNSPEWNSKPLIGVAVSENTADATTQASNAATQCATTTLTERRRMTASATQHTRHAAMIKRAARERVAATASTKAKLAITVATVSLRFTESVRQVRAI